MGRHLKNVRACIVGNHSDDLSKIRGWINAAGGQLQTSLNSDTTHVIASKAAWDAQTQLVTQALSREIPVLTYDWIHESLLQQRKLPEKKYLWTTITSLASKRQEQKLKLAAKQKAIDARNAERARKKAEKEEEAKKKAAGKISYVRALGEHTDAFLGTEGTTAGEKKVVAVAKREISPPASQAAKTFRKGAEQAKNDILSDNYHVYMDSTGFRYDVIVVKTDMFANKNERVIITLYETNSSPRAYAAHAKHTGTDVQTTSETKSVIGSGYAAAFRVWKSIFKVKTGVEWDDRFEAFRRTPTTPTSSLDALKQKREAKASGGGGGSGSGSGGGNARVKLTPHEWANMPFVYRLPAEGQPRGAGPFVRGIQSNMVSQGTQTSHTPQPPQTPQASETRGHISSQASQASKARAESVEEEDEEEDEEESEEEDVDSTKGNAGSVEGSSEENAHVIEDDEESSDGEDSDE